ncbi:MAG: class I tRNA ligase family protein, partial [Candidatus Krumholzibacteria bacterium]|nr:class I tRNA ligase family protein [Candidatus Krumholzibacteria bacterium]
KFELPIVEVISGGDIETEAWSGDGKLINSPLIDGLGVEEAKKKITNWLVEQELGESAVHYKLRDWLFSRQRYWGEPFPLLEQEDGSYRSLGLDELPLTLPEVDRYEPSGTGEGPLATISDWISVEDQVTGKPARRSSNTMPQWAGSCWYYLRFLDPRNPDEAWSREKEEYWMPVDLYLGGTEHAVLHLLYARFWHKVLYDLDLVSTKEPFQRLRNQGMILGENGEKMSKSRGNVVNPDDVIHDFGADSLRLFLMFLGPLERDKPWNTSGIEGIHRFLSRVWRLILDEEDELHASISDAPADEETLRILNKTIDAVTTMTTDLRFNTAISQMMVFVNEMMPRDQRNRQAMESFLLLLAPYAPHLAEELWQRMGHNDPLALEPWPEVDSAWLVEETVTVVVQVNGKLRDQFDLPVDADEALVMEFVEKSEKLQPWLEGKKIVKTIFVPGKLVNLVAK